MFEFSLLMQDVLGSIRGLAKTLLHINSEFKAILRDVMGEENFTFLFFSSYIYVMLSPYYDPSVFSCWVLCVILYTACPPIQYTTL